MLSTYRVRAAMTFPSAADTVATIPTQSITLVAGTRKFYDTITMFQFTTNVPDDCPITKFFRALYAIRDDDAPENREESRNKKREHHTVLSVDSLGQAKRRNVTAPASANN